MALFFPGSSFLGDPYGSVVCSDDPLLLGYPGGGGHGRRCRSTSQRRHHDEGDQLGILGLPLALLAGANNDRAKEIVCDDDEKEFKAILDLSGFNTDEVKVDVDRHLRLVLIHAEQSHGVKEGDGLKLTTQVQRSLFVPLFADLDSLKAEVSTDGHLILRANKLSKEQLEQKQKEAAKKRRGVIALKVKEVGKEESGDSRKEDGKLFRSVFDLSGYRGKDVRVHLDCENRLLLIQADQMEGQDSKEEGGGGDSGLKLITHVERTLFVPMEVDLDKLDVELSDEGKLAIIAPKFTKEELEQKKKDEEAAHALIKLKVTKTGKPAKLPELNKRRHQPIQEQQRRQSLHDHSICNSGDEFSVCVDLAGYDPSDIGVDLVQGDRLIVKAEHAETDADGSVSRRSIAKEFNFPIDRFDPETLESALGKDGMLRIRARPKEAKSEESRRIKVNVH